MGKHDLREVTYGWIRNSLELALIGLSENLSRQIAQNPDLEIVGEARSVEFDASGNLVDMLVPAGEVVGTH